MKILFISNSASNLHLFRLPVMLSLVRAGHEVIAMSPSIDSYAELFKAQGIKPVGFSLVRESLNPLNELLTIFKLIRILKEVSPDLIHAFMFKPNIYTAMASFFLKDTPLICSMTGLGSFYADRGIKAALMRFFLEFLSRFAFLRARRVLFHNREDLELYCQKGLIKRSQGVLIEGSGVDSRFFDPSDLKPETRESYRGALQTEGKTVILMVARAILHKGVREYYAAAEILKQKPRGENLLFLFVGDSDWGNLYALTQEELSASPYVKWLGHRKDIRELLAIADIFVLPSYREGLPKALLEASSMRKAVITTDTTGCREVVANGESGLLVPVGDSNALADAIVKLVDDKSLRERMGERGREIVIARFDVERIVQAHLELYRSILENVPLEELIPKVHS